MVFSCHLVVDYDAERCDFLYLADAQAGGRKYTDGFVTRCTSSKYNLLRLRTIQLEIRLRDRTDRAWFRCILRHSARKRSGSILTTPEPARAQTITV